MEEEIKPVDRVLLYQLITHKGMIPISIGGNCYMKRWTEYVGVSQETHFFDYIGTRGYSLYQLLVRDFRDLFDYQKYGVMRILQEPPGTFVSHHTYFLSFAHSFPGNILTPFAFQRFSSQYLRRLARLKEILRGGGTGKVPVLFLRLEESKERYDDPYYRDVSEGIGEFEYLRRFSGLLREKYPRLNYKILFVQSLPDYAEGPVYLEKDRIITIPKGDVDPNHWSTCHLDLSKIILQHYSFIHQIVTG
jgi:hypothetical protein